MGTGLNFSPKPIRFAMVFSLLMIALIPESVGSGKANPE